jgi:hypothetical protein
LAATIVYRAISMRSASMPKIKMREQFDWSCSE